jgi:hypothetical protein
MSVEKSANPEKLSDLNPFAVLINKAMMTTSRVTITPTPWNGTSTSRAHISSSHTARICSRRMNGLYGNAFARANPDAERRATTRIDPPTITHVIAMAAPSGGRGRYRVDEIEHVLVTAFTAFRAAALESARSRGAGSPVVVHTGFWGCGAFGGHRVLSKRRR